MDGWTVCKAVSWVALHLGAWWEAGTLSASVHPELLTLRDKGGGAGHLGPAYIHWETQGFVSLIAENTQQGDLTHRTPGFTLGMLCEVRWTADAVMWFPISKLEGRGFVLTRPGKLWARALALDLSTGARHWWRRWVTARPLGHCHKQNPIHPARLICSMLWAQSAFQRTTPEVQAFIRPRVIFWIRQLSPCRNNF